MRGVLEKEKEEEEEEEVEEEVEEAAATLAMVKKDEETGAKRFGAIFRVNLRG